MLRKLTSDEGEPKDDGRRQCGEEISQPSAMAPEEIEKGSDTEVSRASGMVFQEAVVE